MVATPNPPQPGPATHRTRRTSRTLRTLIAATALAATAAVSAPTLASAEVGESSSLRPRQPLLVAGTGKVTGKLPFCFNGLSGPCGWVVEGSYTGTPIGSGTFWAAIDDQQAASARRCVPASYTAVLSESPDDYIAHTAEGRVCPDRAGGYVFTGRFDLAGGNGRLEDIGRGHGRLRVTLAANDSATLTMAARLRPAS